MNREVNALAEPGRPSAVSSRWLRLQIVAISLLAVIQTVRILALQLAGDVLAGRELLEWLFPAYVDIFIGITAPFVAFVIWRRIGLVVWTAAIVWFTISILDHLDAVTVIVNMTGQLPGSFPGSSPSAAVISLLVQVALEGLALVLLMRAKMRSLYLGSLRSAESGTQDRRST